VVTEETGGTFGWGVLKASEECPRTHAAIASALSDAGLPPGVVNLLVHEREDAGPVVDALIEHPAVRRINFTGSTKVGRIIAEKAGRQLKRVLLELGGKAPMVVLDDADLDAAVAAAGFGAFFHQGQICMSTERIVADRAVASEFTALLADKASGLVVGDPRAADTQIGPLVNAGAVQRVSELVEDARSKGAEVLSGGSADGLYYAPTVISGVTPEMRLYAEESFGPVVTVVPVDGVDEAVRVANDTEYGLCRRVRSRRPARVRRRAPDRVGHLPRQRRDRPRRAADALRRRQGERLGPLRRPRGARRVHRAAVDHRRRPGGAALPDLVSRSANFNCGIERDRECAFLPIDRVRVRAWEETHAIGA
jgi:acyl-CoA reductase-like NAD-dependent aldehyde dehydrogenase